MGSKFKVSDRYEYSTGFQSFQVFQRFARFQSDSSKRSSRSTALLRSNRLHD
jgi:hypothetical protein